MKCTGQLRLILLFRKTRRFIESGSLETGIPVHPESLKQEEDREGWKLIVNYQRLLSECLNLLSEVLIKKRGLFIRSLMSNQLFT